MGGSSITVNKTGTELFDVAIFSTHPNLYYNINMYNPSGTLAKSWANNVLNADGWVELTGLQVSRADITAGGIYTIYITSNDNNGYTSGTTLTLNVLNSAPTMGAITAPSSINAGEILSVSFTASDSDNDPLNYRIYRNNALISSTNNNAWQTSASDAGTYIYRFEATDGENAAVQTRTIVVSPAGSNGSTTVTAAEIPEVLRLGKDIEISKIYNFLKIRSNDGKALDDFEITVNYLDLNKFETYRLGLGRNDVVYLPLATNLSEGVHLAKIDVNAEDMDDSGYLLIRK
jgi:hypothetical protein